MDMNFSPEDLEALANLGISQDQLENLKSQYGEQSAIRTQQGPQMRGNGRVQTAANPLEFIGDGIQKYRAGKEMGNIQDQQAELLRNNAQVRGDMMRRIAPGGPPPPQAGMPGSQLQGPPAPQAPQAGAMPRTPHRGMSPQDIQARMLRGGMGNGRA